MTISSVGGYVCFDCSDVAKARLGQDPAAPAYQQPTTGSRNQVSRAGGPTVSDLSGPASPSQSESGGSSPTSALSPGVGGLLDRRA